MLLVLNTSTRPSENWDNPAKLGTTYPNWDSPPIGRPKRHWDRPVAWDSSRFKVG